MERQYENYKDVIVDQDCRDCRVSGDQPGLGAAKWYEWILPSGYVKIAIENEHL